MHDTSNVHVVSLRLAAHDTGLETVRAASEGSQGGRRAASDSERSSADDGGIRVWPKSLERPREGVSRR